MSALYLYKKRELDKIASITKIKNTTLLVVVDSEQSDVGITLKQAFLTYWKYSAYKFIKRSEVINYAGKQGFSFFMFIRDEYSVPGPGGPQNAWNSPHLYYQSDTMQNGHKSSEGYVSTYLFLVCISNDIPNKDTKEENIMENVSIADYIRAPTTDDYSYKNAGLLSQKEREAIPEINTIVSDFQDDLDYVYKNKVEYTPVIVPVSSKLAKVYISYESQEVKCRTSVSYYGDAQKTLKSKKILIDSSLADNISVHYLSKILELDTTQIQLANINVINGAIERKDENICYVENPCNSCGTGFSRICNTSGKKILDFPDAVSGIMKGSVLNSNALQGFEANLFNKKADPPEMRKKIRIELEK